MPSCRSHIAEFFLTRLTVLLGMLVASNGFALFVMSQETKSRSADEDSETKQRKERFTKWMTEFAEATKVSLRSQDGAEGIVDLHQNPVFRYSDEQRSISDATCSGATK